MQPGTGAHTSPYDKRTWQHPTTAAPLTEGGVVYQPQDIENQHTVGICTAISLVQNAEKATGKKYSPDFQYLLQKKYFDQNWLEGSSIFAALKVATKYGLLPIDQFPITEADRQLPYSDYIAKLQAIPDTEVQRLLTLTENLIVGYAQVGTDPQSLAQAINSSKSGILTRYEVGQEWWMPSWNPADIDPLRPPQTVVSGHAIGQSYFNVVSNIFVMPNTWGTAWDKQGNADVNVVTYPPTEAWIPYYEALPPFCFTRNLFLGMKSADVQRLQIRLGVKPTTGFFGFLTFAAVVSYQKQNGITPTGFVGPITRAALNT